MNIFKITGSAVISALKCGDFISAWKLFDIFKNQSFLLAVEDGLESNKESEK